MSTSLTVAGAAAIPLEDGGTTAPIDLKASLVFTSRADFARSYSAAVADDPVDLGTLTAPGAKGVLVKCTAGSCSVKFQDIAKNAWPLAPGGYFLWINPSSPFPTAAFITTTGSATVVFIAVG